MYLVSISFFFFLATVIASNVINVTLVITSESCTAGRYNQSLLWRKLNETVTNVFDSPVILPCVFQDGVLHCFQNLKLPSTLYLGRVISNMYLAHLKRSCRPPVILIVLGYVASEWQSTGIATTLFMVVRRRCKAISIVNVSITFVTYL